MPRGRRRRQNPTFGTVVVIGTLSALAIGGAGFAIVQAVRKRKKKKKVKCKPGFEPTVLDGVDVCVPVGQAPTGKTPSKKPPAGGGQVPRDLVFPAPREAIAQACITVIQRELRDYVQDLPTLAGGANTNAEGMIEFILDECGLQDPEDEDVVLIDNRRRVLQYLIDIGTVNDLPEVSDYASDLL